MIIASEAQSQDCATLRAKLRLLLDSGANSLVLLHRASQALNLPIVEERFGSHKRRPGWLAGRQRPTVDGLARRNSMTLLWLCQLPNLQSELVMVCCLLRSSLYVNDREGFVVLNPRTKKN
jgi:hypothetical protein